MLPLGSVESGDICQQSMHESDVGRGSNTFNQSSSNYKPGSIYDWGNSLEPPMDTPTIPARRRRHSGSVDPADRRSVVGLAKHLTDPPPRPKSPQANGLRSGAANSAPDRAQTRN
jgi:hypothetical protein